MLGVYFVFGVFPFNCLIYNHTRKTAVCEASLAMILADSYP